MAHAPSQSNADTPPEPSSDSAAGGGIDAETEFQASDYFRAGWQMLRRDPFLLVWRLLVDGLRWVLIPATFLWIFLIADTWVDGLRTTGLSGPEILGRAFNHLTSLPFVGASVGLIICASLFGFLVDALVTGGIWGTLARGARGEAIERFASFGRAVVPGFPRIVGLRAMSLVAEWMVIFTGLTVGLGLLDAFAAPRGLAQAGTWTQTFTVAGSLFVFFVFAALVRLTFHAAAAPLFVEERPLGESIGMGAELVIRHLAGVYRLVVFAAGLMLIPLMLYWGTLILGNAAGADSAAMIVIWPLQVTVQIFLFASLSCISVIFNAALFGYWARLRGISETLPGLETETDTPDVAGPTGYSRSTTLAELLPERPATVDYTKIPGIDRAGGRTDEMAEDSAGDDASEPADGDDGPPTGQTTD